MPIFYFQVYIESRKKLQILKAEGPDMAFFKREKDSRRFNTLDGSWETWEFSQILHPEGC